MGDFNGIPPFAAATAVRVAAQADKPVVRPVEPSLDTRASGERHDPEPIISRSVDPLDLDENTPTGPPPSFSANVLEMDRSMREAMARIEAQHNRQETEAAIAPSPAEDSAAPDAAEDTAEAKTDAPAPLTAETSAESAPSPTAA